MVSTTINLYGHVLLPVTVLSVLLVTIANEMCSSHIQSVRDAAFLWEFYHLQGSAVFGGDIMHVR